ncbi:hypothetical protein [Vallicoccus soli]|uniref:Uncharacterized protein n=1 Tax=Vallicoccus soli TaxID=2339232 RepID=A0A3A3YY19_9ACTN|nr:hypothetical protein [Vallicoccus soli]RJK94863.1 hypothetical protein D5H78_13740 [Vallicoccus soli]
MPRPAALAGSGAAPALALLALAVPPVAGLPVAAPAETSALAAAVVLAGLLRAGAAVPREPVRAR